MKVVGQKSTLVVTASPRESSSETETRQKQNELSLFTFALLTAAIGLLGSGCSNEVASDFEDETIAAEVLTVEVDVPDSLKSGPHFGSSFDETITESYFNSVSEGLYMAGSGVKNGLSQVLWGRFVEGKLSLDVIDFSSLYDAPDSGGGNRAPTFGLDGFPSPGASLSVTDNITDYDLVEQVGRSSIALSSGEILVAATNYITKDGVNSEIPVLAKIGSDGDLDESFGSSGVMAIQDSLGSALSLWDAVAFEDSSDEDQLVMLLKKVNKELSKDELYLRCLKSDGDHCESFGSAGKIDLAKEYSSFEVPLKLIRDQDDIYVFVNAVLGSEKSVLLFRIREGALDLSYGSGGKVVIAGLEKFHDVTKSSDGFILLGDTPFVFGVSAGETVILPVNKGGAVTSFAFEASYSLKSLFPSAKAIDPKGIQAKGDMLTVALSNDNLPGLLFIDLSSASCLLGEEECEALDFDDYTSAMFDQTDALNAYFTDLVQPPETMKASAVANILKDGGVWEAVVFLVDEELSDQ